MGRAEKGQTADQGQTDQLKLVKGATLTVLPCPHHPAGQLVKMLLYTEVTRYLDFKVVDDDGETIAVLGAGRTSALSASTLAWQAEVRPLGWTAGLRWTVTSTA